MSFEAASSIVADCPTILVETSQPVRRQLAVTRSLAEVTVLARPSGASQEAFPDGLNHSAMGSTFTRYKTSAFGNSDGLDSADIDGPAQCREPPPAACRPAFPRGSD
jgi:hypothetical protein